MTRHNILITILMSFLISVGARAAGERTLENSGSNWVGFLYAVSGLPVCTVFFHTHGEMITAKHCFLNSGLNEDDANHLILSIYFTTDGILDASNTDPLIESSAIQNVKFDEGENDFAYIRYDKQVTESNPFFENVKVKLSDRLPTTEEALQTTGFTATPAFRAGENKILPLVTSSNCTFTGMNGYLAPKPNHIYEGLLHETTCRGWFKTSGSPVYTEDEDGLKTVYGVLTHTFEVLESGDIDPTKIQRDEFGDYTVINISSFVDAVSLSP